MALDVSRAAEKQGRIALPWGAMKTLLILRHAKSSWDDPALDDHERPLNARGLRDAPRMGRLMAREGCLPDLVVSSTAVRARTTARIALAAADCEAPLTLSEDLYLADPSVYVRSLEAADDGLNRIMVVGHNPGLEDLIGRLTGRNERMPTAALAILRVPFESWAEIECPPGCKLLHVWRPKELEPSG
jgi:phosphohistidine phosphatase